MKTTIALLLFGILALIFAGISFFAGKSPHLAGDWKMGGPYDAGQPCQILQAGTNLTFVNEKGDKCRGVLKTQSEVIALDWEGGLTGILTNGATRINWKNGTWWLKEK
jgi:hypothetical protein